MAHQQKDALPLGNGWQAVSPSGRAPGRGCRRGLADKAGDGHHLQDGLQAMEHQERGAKDPVCPQHQGLPEQEVDGQQGAAHSQDQAGGQRHLGLRQVALGAEVQPRCFQNPHQEEQSQVKDQEAVRIGENLAFIRDQQERGQEVKRVTRPTQMEQRLQRERRELAGS
uniref:Transmembrane protein 80 n=1 Tax=Sus scrofa TaxID=9823 RepID=A0A480GML7_PIG